MQRQANSILPDKFLNWLWMCDILTERKRITVHCITLLVLDVNELLMLAIARDGNVCLIIFGKELKIKVYVHERRQ